MMKKLLSALALVAATVCGTAAVAEESGGTITISISEYEKLKTAIKADEKKQYWNMTYEQILDAKNGNEEKAWELYEYWVLRRLSLFGVVNYTSVNSLIEDINILNQIDQEKPITIVVNSPGGGVYNGIMLLNAMERSPAPINTECDSMAASMAAVIVAAGDFRVANPGCHWMIHEVGAGGAPGGQTTDFVKWADFTVDLENILLETVAAKTGLSLSDVRKLGEYETFYTGDELVRLGVVDFAILPRVNSEPHTIPEDLLPLNRIKRNLTEKLDDAAK